MKIYVKSVSNINTLFDDTVTIYLELGPTTPVPIAASSLSRFPGVASFKEDVLDMLKTEFGFEVIQEDNGAEGYISNRSDSVSIYFNCYYDLDNADVAFNILDIKDRLIPRSGTVHCFVHLRISDHSLGYVGDETHNDFLDKNAEKHTSNRTNINVIVKEESVEIDPSTLHHYYDSALQEVHDTIAVRIYEWARKARRLHPELFD